ncbi:MAG: sigma-54-dependent Fis family transcriptional regulator, partial [Myxococcales bacterium]|nr:sigma-54-dependent Fis family transcriptional regulator [Myxococcales bacterium]
RSDLYYRLNVVPIALPPLRDRREDIPLLAEHFLRRYALDLKKEIDGFAPEALSLLVNYRWPGNVRELENVIERAVVLSRGNEILPAAMPSDLHDRARDPADELLRAIPAGFDLQQTLEDIEKRLVIQALRENSFVQARAAAALGISRSHMQYKLKKHGLEAGGAAKE